MSLTNEEDHGEVPHTPPSAPQGSTRPFDRLIDEASRLLLRLKAAPDDRAVEAEATAWRRRSAEHSRAWMTAQKVWALTGQIGADHPVFESRRPVLRRPVVTRRRMMTGAVAAATAAIIAPTG